MLIRHGESLWNRDQRFTGWADVDLTDEGVAQMRDAAAVLHDNGITIDVAFSSVLLRCIRSLWTLLDAAHCPWVPQVLDWRLNERHYGALTGQSKPEAEQTHGKAAVRHWRRGYDARPPLLDAAAGAAATENVTIDRRYAGVPPGALPTGESLHDTVVRVRQVWQQSMAPVLHGHTTAVVVGHGNSLRALIKLLEDVSDQDIVGVEVGNASPIVYDLDARLKPVHKRVLAVAARRPSEIL
ncbi:MAG: 2,3-bisphosphoglycerate-dependent phosphoglycerate mutase [Pseudomonadota bacterium]